MKSQSVNSILPGIFRRKGYLFCALSVAFILCLATDYSNAQDQKRNFIYPEARIGNVIDDYHGTKVPDPYRWLEDVDSEETISWVTAQNELTTDYLNTPEREKFKKKYTKLFNYPKYSLPSKKAGRYFFWKNDGLQNQSVLYMQTSFDGETFVVIDPNTLSEDGTVAVRSTSLSKDATLMAYGISKSGSDWQTIRIRNVATGEEYDETLRWMRFSSPAWKHDKSGFYYDRYPDPATVDPGEATYYNRVYWHKLGTPQSEDILVYERPDNKELGFAPQITEDDKYLILQVWRGTDSQNRIYYRGVESSGDFIRLLDKADAEYSFIGNTDSLFYFKTDLDAPRGRIIAIDITRPDRENWREIISEQDDVLHFIKLVNNQMVVAYMHDAHHQLKLYDLDGAFVREIELPTIGSVSGITGKREDTEMMIGFESFLYPRSAFRYNFTTGEMIVFHTPEIDFDPSGYETRQVFFKSKDGTRVPMFITHKKDIVLEGNNPTRLYGYGGFRASQTPYFSISATIWMELGGVLALACLRGGNEYGEAWHQAGMLENKQNVYDDFIAAGEWLIDNNYTKSSRLAMEGGSNGGLLVAACMVQRPELFGAVICAVPLTDMLRYHKLGVGHWWVGEYGNAEENADHFKFIADYSPYHNVKKGVSYPPTLITTADTDDRVVPSHGKKFTAVLQANDSGKNPILLRVEMKAGHGGGKPTSKIIDEVSDKYAFYFKVFGMEVRD